MRSLILILAILLIQVKSTRAASDLLRKDVKSSSKSIYADFGFSTSLLLSDLSNKVFASGLGNQFSIGFNTGKDKNRGLKFHLQKMQLKQNNWRETKVPNSNLYFRNFEQEWTMLAIGVEKREHTRLLQWWWDTMIGFNFGRQSRVQVQEEASNSAIQNIEERTKTGLHLSAAVGIRKALNKKITLQASLRSFLVLGRIYSDEYKDQNFILLPILTSVGLEYSF